MRAAPTTVHPSNKERITMSNIRETITDALIQQGVDRYTLDRYSRLIDAATSALQERETERDHSISDALIAIATDEDHNLGLDDVREALTEAGLSVRPVPTPEPALASAAVNNGQYATVEDVQRIVTEAIASAIRQYTNR